MQKITIIAAVNNDEVLGENLLRSPDVAGGQAELIVRRGHTTAGAAYNAGLMEATTELVALVHQDVYLPAGWLERLQNAVDKLEADRLPWGVLGVWGIAGSESYCGKVWCTGGNMEHVGRQGTHEVVSIDEIVIVIKRSSGLRFDEKLPGFHLYATDIVMQAQGRGLRTYVFDGPVIHNSRVNFQPLDKHYWAAYRYMQRKWNAKLPLSTCVVPVTQGALPLWKQWLRNEVRRRRRRNTHRPRLDPVAKACELGYESKSISSASRMVPNAASGA